MHNKLSGSHTGENIKTNVHQLLMDFALVDKVRAIISDNASNMVKAFAPTISDEGSSDEDDDRLPVENTEAVLEDIVFESSADHLRCFAHSLQLTIKDGLEHAKFMTPVLGKCSKITVRILCGDLKLCYKCNYVEIMESLWAIGNRTMVPY